MFLFAQAEDPEAPVPQSIDEVKDTLMGTLGGVWKSFLEHLPLMGAGILVLIGTWIVVAIVSRMADRLLKKKKSMRQSLRELFLRFISIGLWFAGLMIAAMVVFPGLTPAKALGALGLLSVAVGFAFKDIFENFFAGILILWRFPFESGDFIECEGIRGRIEDVEMRMTKIRKTTGELVVLPNAVIFKSAVEILTSTPHRRVHIAAGVGYGEDVAESVKVIEQAVASCESVNTDKPIEICPSGFGASSIDIDVAFWTGSAPREARHTTGHVITAIKKALDEAGIEIPFPYRTLTFSEPLKLENTAENAESS